MKTIRPANTDPIPLRVTPPPISTTVMLRFAGVLILAAIVMVAVYLR
jgi:hypothetical protein